MEFHAIKSKVLNRGVPPDSFLREVVEWANSTHDEIFAPNPNTADIYALIKSTLGPWISFKRRKAAMLEVMRVHAGFESSWNWNEGVDVTNKTSLKNIAGQETGIFQVSYDSVYLGDNAMKPYVLAHGIETPVKFIREMKRNHRLAMEYYARLIRVNIQWAGPLKRKEILPWLKIDAVTEFESFLTT